MKKVISVFLAILMALSLFACSGKTSTTPSSSPSASSAPAGSETPSASTPSASDSEEVFDVTTTADELGFFYSGVDPMSRKKYNLVFAYPYTLLLFQKMHETMDHFADKLNFNPLITTTGENDADVYLQNVETLSAQDVDGFIMELDMSIIPRTIELLDEIGKPYISLFNSVRDEEGNNLVPCVGLDQKKAGATTVEWLYDNYKTYWGDADTSKIGLISFTLSISTDLNDRAEGAEEKYKELVKNDNIWRVDGVSGDRTAQTGFDLASATLAGNPQIEHWFITSCLEQYAQGAARAAEALNMEDKVLVTAVGSDILTTEWDTNYDGSWVSCLAISNYLYAAPTVCGLIAMLDGKATPESLWTDQKGPNDKAAFYKTSNSMITKDTYKEYFNKYAQLAEAPLPYAE